MIVGRQFLDVADALAAHHGEAFVRTRIGRIYYGTWLEARTFCEQRLGYSRQKMAREHQAIAALLGQLDANPGVDLHFLRVARNQADYDNDLSAIFMSDLLRSVQASSARVLTRLDALKAAAPKENE